MYLIIYGGHLLKRRKYPYLEAWYKCDQCKRERSPIHTGAWHTGVFILFYFLHLVIKQYNPKTQHVVWAMYLKKLWASNNVIGQNSISIFTHAKTTPKHHMYISATYGVGVWTSTSSPFQNFELDGHQWQHVEWTVWGQPRTWIPMHECHGPAWWHGKTTINMIFSAIWYLMSLW